jgi:hypothetical protein
MAPTQGKPLTISPSKLERAVLCPGSPRMTKDIPWKDSPAASRGRALHDAMALLFQTRGQGWAKVRESIPGNPACKPEDIKQVEAAWEWGRELLPADAGTLTVIEQPLKIDWMGLAGGKPDAIFISPKFKQAVLIDWKFGSGKVEDPESNWQMRAYSAGVLSTYPEYELQAIEAAIIQPASFQRDDSVRSHVFTKDALRGMAEEIKRAVAAAKVPDAPLIAGPQQCRFCDAKTACPAYAAYAAGKAEAKEQQQQLALASVTTDGTPVTVEPPEPLSFPVVVINAETVALAEDRKAQALSTKVVSADTAESAGRLSKDIRALANLIDKNREQVKRPFLELGRQIDAEAKRAMTPLAEAAAHLDAQVQAWVRTQEEAARKVREEEARKQREAEEAAARARAEEQRKADEAAAAARAAQEAAARAEQAKTKAAREKAQREAEEQAAKAAAAQRAADEEAAKRRHAEQQAQMAEVASAATEGPAKVAGYRQVTQVSWEIPDLEAVPKELLGVVLMPNAKVIDQMVKTGALTEAKHGAWLKITRETGVARSR